MNSKCVFSATFVQWIGSTLPNVHIMTKRLSSLLLSFCFLFPVISPAAILLDFGNPDVAIGTEQGPAGISGSWQQITESSTDITLAGGETLRMVRGANNTALSVQWGSQGNPDGDSANDPPVGSIMATESNVYRDYIRNGDNGRGLAWRLSGLDVGTYDVYFVINDASTESGSRAAVGVLENADANGQVFVSNLGQTTTALLEDSDRSLTSWTAASGAGSAYNYIKATVTLDDADDYIVGFMESARGTGSTNQMGFHSVQVVLVPEPSSLVLMSLSLLAMLQVRRSRRR